MYNPFGEYGILNPFKSTRLWNTGSEPSTALGGPVTVYYYEEAGLKTRFNTAEELMAYKEKRDAEERKPKILTAVAVLLILAGLWFAFKKK